MAINVETKMHGAAIITLFEELGKKHQPLNHLLGGDSTLYQSQIISWQLWAFKGTNAIEQF